MSFLSRDKVPVSLISIWLQDYISDIANIITTMEDEEFVIESVGILANLTFSDIDWALLLQEYNMVDWIKSRLQTGKTARVIGGGE